MTTLLAALTTLQLFAGPGATDERPQPAAVAAAPKGLEVAPWSGLEVAQCAEALERAGVQRFSFVRRSRVKKLKRWRGHDPLYCHVPQGVVYRQGPGDIAYTGHVRVNCRMAIALAEFEQLAQQVSEEVFGEGKRIKSIRQLGTYNCRRLRRYPEFQSEHSFGNAIDVASFRIRGVGKVDLKTHWGSRLPFHADRRRFLRTLSERLKASGIFTFVLDPDYDSGHDNHFHLDLAGERVVVAGNTASNAVTDDEPGRDGAGHMHLHDTDEGHHDHGTAPRLDVDGPRFGPQPEGLEAATGEGGEAADPSGAEVEVEVEDASAP